MPPLGLFDTNLMLYCSSSVSFFWVTISTYFLYNFSKRQNVFNSEFPPLSKCELCDAKQAAETVNGVSKPTSPRMFPVDSEKMTDIDWTEQFVGSGCG